MLLSLCYRSICWLLEFVVLRTRPEEFKELEIVVLAAAEQPARRARPG